MMFAPLGSGVTPLGTMFTSSVPTFAGGAVWPPPPLPPTSISGGRFLSPTRTPVGGLDLTSRLGFGREVQRCASESNFNGTVWPPPPLPPVSCEITARIESLERMRISSLEQMHEKNFELDAVGAEWKAKVELLEAKLRAQATAGSRQAEEAVRNVEFRVRDEMRAEVQGVSETLRRSYQDEIDRLKSDLRQAEATINELESGFGRRDTIIEDLSRQLEAMTNERDLLSSDNVHLRKANAQREQESSTLRVMLNEERKHLKLLENERDTLKADIEAQTARARLSRDEEVLSGLSPRRQSFGSQGSIYESRARNSRGSNSDQPTFSVDLTAVQESFSPRRSSTGSFSQIRRVVELDGYDD